MTIKPIGDQALTIELGQDVDDATVRRVRAIARLLEEKKSPLIVEIVPAYTTVTVVYDTSVVMNSGHSPIERVQSLLSDCVAEAETRVGVTNNGAIDTAPARTIKIPVCYGGGYGPDVDIVATHCGLTVDEVISRHAGATYDVAAVGFSPGFPYLRGLPKELETARRPTPRTKVPAGSVGIGGTQTGIYPSITPGGWQLIGRTPLRLFDVMRQHPALLRVGDRINFVPMTDEEFSTWRLP